jgi:hypothetical protein
MSGSIDPQTGVFSALGIQPGQPCIFPIQGTAAPDGNSLSMTAQGMISDCPGGPGSCTCTPAPSLSYLRGCRNGVVGDCCGDHVVGPTETCDNGPEGPTGCCDETCQPRAGGTACTPDFSVCTDDVCDGAGICAHPALPDGDGDGVCDLADACTSGVALQKPSLRLSRFTTPPGDDALTVHGRLQLGAPLPTVDPITNGLRFTLRDGNGQTFADVTIPAGAYLASTGTGWTTGASGHGFTFRARAPSGPVPVRRAHLMLNPNAPGLVNLSISARRGTFATALPTLPLTLAVSLDPAIPSTPACAELRFADGSPRPACIPRSNGAFLVCR